MPHSAHRAHDSFITAPTPPIAREQWSARGIAVMLLCFVLNMVDGVNIFTLTYVAPALQKHYGAGPEAFSIVFSAGLVGMALGGLVLAPLADRLGRRPVVLAALAMMAAAMAASAHAPNIAILSLIRVFVGLGIGTVLASITALSAGFAPDHARHIATGVPQAGYPIGATLAGFLIAWALPAHGWQAMFTGAGLVTALLLPVCWFALPEAPDRGHHARASIAEAIGGGRLRVSALLWCCTIGGFAALYFIASWITRLAIAAGLPPHDAIIASAIYNIGACVGTIALSLIATRIDLRKLLLAMMILASGLFLLFGGVPMGLPALLLVSFLIGVTLQGGVNCNYPLVASVYPAHLRATGLGWAMGIGRIGSLMGPLVGGWAMGAQWPLVMVFAFFCVPMLITGACAMAVRIER
jgi:MFS transporter, AAHS family, 4-hydroxybenzoate transporter